MLESWIVIDGGIKSDISPANAPGFAADIVETTQRVDGIVLDYSVASLDKVDEILGDFHAEWVTVEEIAGTVFGFGCYVGEVFVCNGAGCWRQASQDEIESVYGVPLVIVLETSCWK